MLGFGLSIETLTFIFTDRNLLRANIIDKRNLARKVMKCFLKEEQKAWPVRPCCKCDRHV